MTTCDARLARRCLGAGLVVAALAVAPPGLAQAQDQAAARVLFEEGRALTKAGKTPLACPKFEAASKLYTSVGILLNLADCYEKLGRTASAWTQFGEAATVASRASRPDDEAEARTRRTAIEPKLSRLVVTVAHPSAGLIVKRDDTVLPMPAWGVAIPVDPGEYEVRAEDEQGEPWTKRVAVREPGKTVTVEVPDERNPAVAVAVAPPTPPPAKPAVAAPPKPPAPVPAAESTPAPRSATPPTSDAASPTDESSGRKTTAYWIGGAGAASLAVGLVTGAMVIGKKTIVSDHCDASGACDDAGLSAASSGKTLATVSTVTTVLGLAGLGVGAYFLLTAGDSSGPTAALHVAPTVGGGSIAFTRSF